MRIQLTKIMSCKNYINLVNTEKIQYFSNSYQGIKAHMTELFTIKKDIYNNLLKKAKKTNTYLFLVSH